MTFKEEGNIKVDRLRTLILGEADWNMGGRWHINRNMLQQAERHNLIPAEHYGGRNKYKATDVVLTKRLTLDTFRLAKEPAAITSTDVANCYDRMVHSFITMSARRLGTSMSVLLALLRPIQESRHFIRTAYGDSKTFYGGRREIPYQGSGQGNASSSPFWLIVSAPLINLLTANNVCASFTSAITLVSVALTMVMYVDDNDIYVTSSRTNKLVDVVNQSQHNLRTWKQLLEVTGGVVRPKKCSWGLVAFKWHNGDYEYCTTLDHPATLYLEDEDGVDKALDRIEPDEGVKSLGVYTQLDGEEDSEIEYLEGKITLWNSMIKHSPLPANMNLQAMLTRITRTVCYPLPATNLTMPQCRALEAQLYQHSLPKCGISSKYPLVLRYSPSCFMGLSIPEFYSEQGVQHVSELFKHYGKQTTSGKQLFLQMELARLILGSQKWMFDLNATKYQGLLDMCWLKTTWEFISNSNLIVRAPHVRLHPPRVQDVFLTDAFVANNILVKDIQRLNQCRLYLQVLTLSDICDASGYRILPQYMNGTIMRNRNRQQDRISCYNWPAQGKPGVSDWRLWEQTIRTIVVLPHTDSLKESLREWKYRSHQRWLWRYNVNNNWLYYKSDNVYIRYAPDPTMRLATRTSGRWYKRQDVVTYADTDSLFLCTIARQTSNHVLLMSTSMERVNDMISMEQQDSPSPTWDTYRLLVTYDHGDNGARLAETLLREEAVVIGDGSFDIMTSEGSAAIICETRDSRVRATNAVLVPTNAHSIYHQTSDPYRCELTAVLLALLLIYDLEQRYSTNFIGVTIAVDNDKALETSMIYDDLVETTQQHFDIISSIRAIRKKIKTPLSHMYVEGHLDSHTRYENLTREQQLKVEADYLAKGI